MGWDSCQSWITKSDAINETLKGYETSQTHRILGYKSTSQALYIGLETTNDKGETETFIAVYLIERRGKDVWRKGMSEHMGPIVYDCPLDLLSLVPCPNNQYAKDWRQSVLDFHASKAKGKNTIASLKKGDTFDLYGKKYIFQSVIDGKKSIRAFLEGTFQVYKITPKHFQFINLKNT